MVYLFDNSQNVKAQFGLGISLSLDGFGGFAAVTEDKWAAANLQTAKNHPTKPSIVSHEHADVQHINWWTIPISVCLLFLNRFFSLFFFLLRVPVLAGAFLPLPLLRAGQISSGKTSRLCVRFSTRSEAKKRRLAGAMAAMLELHERLQRLPSLSAFCLFVCLFVLFCFLKLASLFYHDQSHPLSGRLKGNNPIF